MGWGKHFYLGQVRLSILGDVCFTLPAKPRPPHVQISRHRRHVRHHDKAVGRFRRNEKRQREEEKKQGQKGWQLSKYFAYDSELELS